MLSHNEFWPHKYFNKFFLYKFRFLKIFSYKDLNHTQEYFFYQYTDNLIAWKMEEEIFKVFKAYIFCKISLP